MPARLTSPAAIALALLAAAVIACGEAPPTRLTPAPEPRRSWEGFVDVTEQEEAMVLARMKSFIPSLMKRVWGLPPDTVRWNAAVWVRGVLDTSSATCFDTTVTPSPRERTRFHFCRDVHASLHPTDSAWWGSASGHRRVVSIGLLDIRSDTLFVNVGVSAERPCPGGTATGASVDFRYHYVRRPGGRWRLADDRPIVVGGGGPMIAPDAPCVMKPLVDPYSLERRARPTRRPPKPRDAPG